LRERYSLLGWDEEFINAPNKISLT